MNLHIIVGRVGHDPELQQLPSGTQVCNASIATDESYKDREGQQVKRATWHRVTLFGPSSESFARHVSKGRSVAVTGQVRRRKAQDAGGQEREYVDTVARTWEFAGSGDNGQHQPANGNGRRNQQRRGTQPRGQHPGQPHHGESFEDDIPF